MKNIVKRMSAIFLAGCVFLGMPNTVKAAKTISSDLSAEWGWTCYDCGTQTEDGLMQIRSTSNSLHVGDIVQVQWFYNAQTNGSRETVGMEASFGFDDHVLEYQNAILPEEHILNYDAEFQVPPVVFEEEGHTLLDVPILYNQSNRTRFYCENACVVTINFKVIKEVETTQIYARNIETSGYDSPLYNPSGSYIIGSGTFWEKYYYEDNNSSDPADWWEDFLTLEIRDSSYQSSQRLPNTISTNHFSANALQFCLLLGITLGMYILQRKYKGFTV